MRSQHIRAFGLLVGLVAVLGMASVAAGESLTDEQIRHQTEHRLSGDMFHNVAVSVQASVVSLSGSVPSLWAKTKAIAEAQELADVTSVVSDTLHIERAESDRALAERIEKRIRRVTIPVLPASTFDNELRAHIARQIYGNVLRPHVSTAAPVHIIVIRLRVTLAGTVLSGVEKLKAEIGARHVFGVLSVQNNLRTEFEING